MPPEKRKAGENAASRQNKKRSPGFVCTCEAGDHVNEVECKRDERLVMHKDIADKACPWSEKVEILVGKNQSPFYVDKILLQLHSGYFRNRLADFEKDQDQKLALPNIDPGLFAEFVCWMKSGGFMPVKSDVLHSDCLHIGERSWALGQFLCAPGFQNFAMDDCRLYSQQGNPWPLAGTVQLVYQLTGRDSKLRYFAAHSVFRKNPFEEHSGEAQELTSWSDTFKNWPELGLDMARAASTKWNGLFPWDDEHRGLYMEDEKPLDEVWEEMILRTRSLDEIKREARGHCVRSKIELDHLNRNK